MSKSVEVIDITPHQTLMPKLGKTGYSIPQAIAELVDNAIDARIEGSPLVVAVKIGKHGISVADNGTGMGRGNIHNAMILGMSAKENMLGEFGLGLKTSCTALGRRFKVMSSQLGDPHAYEVAYDEDEWINAGSSWQMELQTDLADPGDHYTVVEISKLYKYYAGVVDVVQRDLQQRFAPFINDGTVELRVNKRRCKPEEFDLLEDTRAEFEITDALGNRVYGWHGLLKQGSNKGLYGFHTYRLGRMITTFDKMAIGEHPTISRIIGEVHFDHLQPTHNKREWEKNAEYDASVEALRSEVQDLLRQARQRASSDSITKAVRNELERWKDSIARALMARELKPFTSPVHTLSEYERSEDDQAQEQVEVEQRQRTENPELSAPRTQPTESSRERVPRVTHQKPRHAVKVKGKSVDFDHEFAPLGEKEAWYQWSYSAEEGLAIYTNTEFPAYFTTRDKAFYATLHIAESIAELLIQEAGVSADEFDDIRQLIMRKAAAVKDQWIEEEVEEDSGSPDSTDEPEVGAQDGDSQT
ncbi:MAG: ATP-binding protein [Coriobacteriia bacterium]